MRPLTRLFSFTLLLYASLAPAQILIPNKVKPFEPIVGRCDCIIPKDGEVTLDWRADPTSHVIEVQGEKGIPNVHVWAAPGSHWLEVTVQTTYWKEIIVWTPDSEFPDDVTKAKKEKLRFITKAEVQHWEKTYTVLSPGPLPPDVDPDVPPDVDPDPTPGPQPTGDFAKKALAWAKDAGVSAADLSTMGDIYLSVGAQGLDPARSSGWDLMAYATTTKTAILETIGVDKVSSWAAKFFDPLAKYQSDLFKARALKTTDRAGISKLWTETGEAFKTAAKALPTKTSIADDGVCQRCLGSRPFDALGWCDVCREENPALYKIEVWGGK